MDIQIKPKTTTKLYWCSGENWDDKEKKWQSDQENKEVLGKENVNVHSGTSVVYDTH